MKKPATKSIGSFLGGAIATAAIPPSVGCYDWKVIAAAAVAGGVGALCGVNVAGIVRARMKRPSG